MYGYICGSSADFAKSALLKNEPMGERISLYTYAKGKGIAYTTAAAQAASGRLGPVSLPEGRTRPLMLDVAELQRRGLMPAAEVDPARRRLLDAIYDFGRTLPERKRI